MTKQIGAIINKFDRKIFNFLASPQFSLKEYGGYLDFNHQKQLERFKVNIGELDEISLDPDYEIMFHTHPGKFGHISPPTPDDIVFILGSSKQQAHLIFHTNHTYILMPTFKIKNKYNSMGDSAFKQMLKTKWYQISNKLRIHAINAKFEKLWILYLKSLGMKIIKDKNINSSLYIPIKTIEPKYVSNQTFNSNLSVYQNRNKKKFIKRKK